MQAQDKQQLSGFTATIDDDKQIISGTVFSPAFKKMKQFSSVGMQKLDLTAMTPTHVAGTRQDAEDGRLLRREVSSTPPRSIFPSASRPVLRRRPC